MFKKISHTTNIADLNQAGSWVNDQAQCTAWAGDIVRFPFLGNSLVDDIEFTQHQHFIIKIHDDLAAFAQLQTINPHHAHIGRLIINPKFRGQGIAPKFFKMLTDKAREQNPQISLITLNVLETNLTALRIYAAQGFEQYRFLPPDVIQMRSRF
ncbi:MAG: GNAT family N-acetyltransferase [Alphaproteobacteria bacterium]|nr:GNAT family N-acetyltransferase [Alphaproteobacteria bacterium]